MKVFVDNRAGENMCLIEVENSDTVLAIKEKIKRLLRFHVSNQFLYFNDKFLFHNNVRAEQLKIGPNSHLQLYVPPPTHSPAPSNSTKQISHVQDSPVMVRTNQEQPLTTNEISTSQDSSVMVRRNKNESLSLGKKEELLGIQDSFPTVQSPEASEIFKELNIPNLSSVMNMSSLRPEITQQMSHVQDSPKQLWTTEESDFVNEIINIPDSPAKKKIKTIPRKLTLMVKPSEESRSIPVEVNESDDVIELRKELFKMQERGELNLPQQGFYLMRDLTILDETQSFKENRLTQGDTIEIYGEYFTTDDDSTTTSV